MPDFLLHPGDDRQRRHLHARGDDERVHIGEVQALVDLHQLLRIVAPDLEVVGDLEREEVIHFEVLGLQVVDHELRQRLEVRAHYRNAARLERPQALDQRARAGHHRRRGAVLHGALVQPRLGSAVVADAHAHDGDEAGIAQHVHARVGEFQRAAVAVAVHRLQFLLHHLLHAHAARVEGKALRRDLLAGQQHGRDLGFHRRVRRGDDLADTEIGLAH